MKEYKIKNQSKDKTFIGDQTVHMSQEESDNHTIAFFNEVEQPSMLIDLKNSELVLNNEQGWFDAISSDKPIAKIKVSNIRLDSKDNLTFTMDGADGTKTPHRITGNTIEHKVNGKFEVVKSFEKVLDVFLPKTFFEDVKNDLLKVTNLPFQMFDALTPEDGAEKFTSQDGNLNLLRINGTVYVGKGSELIPIDVKNAKFYKVGDESVLGITIGSQKGIQGKKTKGIGFTLTEEELTEVAKFLLQDKYKDTVFKSETSIKRQAIDYKIVSTKEMTKTSIIVEKTDDETGGGGGGTDDEIIDDEVIDDEVIDDETGGGGGGNDYEIVDED